MDPRFARLEALFQAARRLQPAERAAYLARECGDDSAMREEVMGLLEALGTGPSSGGEPEGGRYGEFHVVRLIARGGMSVVYEAEREGARVALKVLHPGVASEEGVRRFAREAEILARLSHPGIARFLAHGAVPAVGGESHFIAMELVLGSNFRDAARAMEPRARLALLAKVADAVAHAHQHGVIHRDLKPGNILVTPEGVPKVLDFGIARLVDADTLLRTRTGQILGTLAYMSPEQAVGDLDRIDERTDVYSLGVLGYEVLCGRLPHEMGGDPLPVWIARIVDEEPPAPESLNPTLRGGASVILTTALAKEPSRRYAGAGALAEDIRRHLGGGAILARPPTASYQVRRFLRRHKALAGGVAATILALVAGLILALRYAADEGRERRRADRNAAEARWAAAHAAVEAATADMRADAAAAARRHLAEVPPEYRGWEWEHFAARTDDSFARAPLDILPPCTLALSPDARRLLALDERGLALLDVEGGVRTETAAPAGTWACLGFLGEAPVALGRIGKECAYVLPETGEVRALAGLGGRQIQTIATTRDGSRLAFADGHDRHFSHIRIFDGATGTPLRGFRGDAVAMFSLAFSGDGRILAASGWYLKVGLFDVESGTALREMPGHTGAVRTMAFSPDATRIASGSDDKSVRIWRVADGTELHRLSGHGGEILSLAWAQSGDRLATADTGGVVRIWDASSGSRLRTLQGNGDAAHALAWLKGDDTLLAAGPGGARRFDVSRGHDPDRLRHHRTASVEDPFQSYLYAVAFSPDGSLLASGGWDSTVRLVDPDSGDLLATLDHAGETRVFDLAFDPAGARLVSGCSSLCLWSATTGERLVAQRFPLPLLSFAFSPTGDRFAAADKNALRFFDGRTGEEGARQKVGRHGCRAVAWSHDALATAGDDGCCILRGATGGEVRWSRLAHPGGAFAVAFDPEGGRLATAGQDRMVRIWEAATGKCLLTLAGHVDRVYCVAFHPEGHLLASGANDNTIRLWDLDRGVARAELRGHENYVYDLAFSPDGATLASASGDGSVRLWTTRGAPERRARADASRAARAAARPLVERVLATTGGRAAAAAAIRADAALGPAERRAALHFLLLCDEQGIPR